MKVINSLTLLFFIVNLSFAQNLPATNQWIDFEQTYYKVKVAEDGIYRIDYNTLKQQGFPSNFTDGNQLNLIHQGKEVPLFVSNVENWGEGEYIEFYGKKLDGTFDKRLYENSDHQLHPYWSQFTDTAVYFLSHQANQNQIIEIQNDLNNLPEKETYFIHTSILQFNRWHSMGLPDLRFQNIPSASSSNQIRTASSHFASYGEGEGWIGNLYTANFPIAENTFMASIHTPSIFDTAGQADINFTVTGLSRDTLVMNNHHLQVHLNNQLLVDDKFGDYIVKSYNLQLPVKQLTSPQTQFEFTAVPSQSNDKQAFSHLVIDYPRSYDFEDIDHFSFTIKNKDTGNYLEFDNLKKEEAYYLYDLTNYIKIKLQYHTEKQIHQVYLPAGNGEKRELILQVDHQIKTVDTLTQTNFTDYSNQTNQGDYIIITHPILINGGGAVNNYFYYRSSEAGGGYNSIMVNVENLYDQYSYGIRKHPLAIKYFLNEAIENWELTPTHCLLLGKGIKNSKCRNSAINWSKNLVPSFGDTPNDQYFGAEGFNPLSRIAIGRLSVDNAEDIQHYLNKVFEVEGQNVNDDCNYFEDSQWKHQLFHLVGGDDLVQQARFQERMRDQANLANNGAITANTSYLFKTDNEDNACLNLPPECLAEVFKEGKRIINFLGHASGLLWEIDIKEPKDYTFNQKYPVMIAQCSFNADVYKSYYDEGMLAMPETWLQAKNAGGVAYIGFNLLFEMLYGADLIDDLYAQMFQLNANLSLGEQVNAALKRHYNVNDSITFHTTNQFIFSGDPALKYAINPKPELVLKENDVSVTVDRINDFDYSVEIVFDFNSLNIPSTDSISYNIIQLAGDIETEVSNELIKIGEQGFYKGEFTLLPNEAHLYRIQLDNSNQWNEICEDNNAFQFITGKWVIGVEDELLKGNTINNHPNPFSMETTFDISLNQAVLQQDNYLTISNLNGKKVHQLKLVKGQEQQSIKWNGFNMAGNKLPAGLYNYQLKNSDGQILSHPGKLILMNGTF